MALAPPDVESAVVATLTGVADSVATRVPNPRPVTAVRVTRAGGQGRNLIQSDARILVECWADDTTTAFDIARMAYARLWAAQDSFLGDVWVTRIEFTEPVNFPDPNTKQARYQFIAQLTASLTDVDLDSTPEPAGFGSGPFGSTSFGA